MQSWPRRSLVVLALASPSFAGTLVHEQRLYTDNACSTGEYIEILNFAGSGLCSQRTSSSKTVGTSGTIQRPLECVNGKVKTVQQLCNADCTSCAGNTFEYLFDSDDWDAYIRGNSECATFTSPSPTPFKSMKIELENGAPAFFKNPCKCDGNTDIRRRFGDRCELLSGSDAVMPAGNYAWKASVASFMSAKTHAGKCVYWEVDFSNESDAARIYIPYPGVTSQPASSYSASPNFRTAGALAWGSVGGEKYKKFGDAGELTQKAPNYHLGFETTENLKATLSFVMDYSDAATPTLYTYLDGVNWAIDETVGKGLLYPFALTTNDGFDGAKWAGATMRFGNAGGQPFRMCPPVQSAAPAAASIEMASAGGTPALQSLDDGVVRLQGAKCLETQLCSQLAGTETVRSQRQHLHSTPTSSYKHLVICDKDQWETKWQDKKEYYENPALCTSLKNWGVDSQWYDNCSCNCCFNSIKEQFQQSITYHLRSAPVGSIVTFTVIGGTVATWGTQMTCRSKRSDLDNRVADCVYNGQHKEIAFSDTIFI